MDLRLADVDDHQDVLALMVRELPHMQPSELEPVFDDRDLAPLCTTWVAEEESSLVGCAVLFQLKMDPTERCVADLLVTAACRGRGIGHALNNALEAAAPSGTTQLRARVYDDDARSLAVAEHWGYVRDEREIFSRLELGDVTAPELPEGVTVTTHHDYRPTDAAAVDGMLDASQTNPERESMGPFDLGRLRASLPQDETPLMVVTRVHDAPVAISTASVAGDIAWIGYTGVDPEFRGRGLAKLTKQAIHAEARAVGARVCMTTNEEHNLGIRRINAELGYRVDHGYWRVTKTLRAV
jgi:GNAT superfamily N-acetyltransferase